MIPNVFELIKDFFNRKEPKKPIEPDKALAYGPAVSTAIFSLQVSKQTDRLLLAIIIPLKLGIETGYFFITVLSARSTTVHPPRNRKLLVLKLTISKF